MNKFYSKIDHVYLCANQSLQAVRHSIGKQCGVGMELLNGTAVT